MNTPLTIYTVPFCVQCTMTKRALDRVGIPYIAIDLTTDQDGLELVRELGYTAAPVVTAGQEHWSGFRPDKIATVATIRGNAQQSQSPLTNTQDEERSE